MAHCSCTMWLRMPIEGGEEDAEGSEDDEDKGEALAPASKLKGKGKKRMEPQDPEESEKETDKTMAATKLDKGKGREVVLVDDTMNSVWPSATQNNKKQQSPKSSGRKHNPGCKRCVRIRKECYNQVGFASACVTCAKVKMRCEVLDAEEKRKEVRIVKPPPPTTLAPSQPDVRAMTLAPLQSVVPAKRSAPEPTPCPLKKQSKKKLAPAPSGSSSV